MASKKSSAVPNNPTAATVAPSDSRYLGRNFFQSSSPSPARNTAPEAAATFRSIPRESAIVFWMRPPGLATNQHGHLPFSCFSERPPPVGATTYCPCPRRSQFFQAAPGPHRMSDYISSEWPQKNIPSRGVQAPRREHRMASPPVFAPRSSLAPPRQNKILPPGPQTSGSARGMRLDPL